MGTITRSFANNLTTGGVLKAGAFNNASLNNVTALNAAVATGGMVLLSSQTASSSASISFTTGIDSTYKEYQFWFIDIDSVSSNTPFQFNLSTDGGSNYNVTKTTTWFYAFHNESDATTGLAYEASYDLAQGTGYQNIGNGQSSESKTCGAGSLSLFNPASTTYVKHFISNMSSRNPDPYATNDFVAGYGNTTSAVNAIRFQFASGNISAGTILMYGIK
jgi:hypothetical protein